MISKVSSVQPAGSRSETKVSVEIQSGVVSLTEGTAKVSFALPPAGKSSWIYTSIPANMDVGDPDEGRLRSYIGSLADTDKVLGMDLHPQEAYLKSEVGIQESRKLRALFETSDWSEWPVFSFGGGNAGLNMHEEKVHTLDVYWKKGSLPEVELSYWEDRFPSFHGAEKQESIGNYTASVFYAPEFKKKIYVIPVGGDHLLVFERSDNDTVGSYDYTKDDASFQDAVGTIFSSLKIAP